MGVRWVSGVPPATLAMSKNCWRSAGCRCDHATIQRWVVQYVPRMSQLIAVQRRWDEPGRMDERLHDPSADGRVVDRHPAPSQQFFDMARAQGVRQIPPYTHQHDVLGEMARLSTDRHRVLPHDAPLVMKGVILQMASNANLRQNPWRALSVRLKGQCGGGTLSMMEITGVSSTSHSTPVTDPATARATRLP